MLSKKMYSVLSQISLPTEAIAYETLRLKCGDMDTNTFNHLLIQARNVPCNYIFASSPLEEAIVSLTESGVAEIEAYEEREENKRVVEETLKATRASLAVAKIAKNAAIASAFAAFLALLPRLPDLISFLQSLFPPAQ